MSSVKDDQLVYEYLSKVADAAHGKLPSLARQELVERVRREIEERRTRAGSRTDVTKVLQSMGDPRTLVARAAQEGGTEYAGYRPPPVTGRPAAAQAPATAAAGPPPPPPPGPAETTARLESVPAGPGMGQAAGPESTMPLPTIGYGPNATGPPGARMRPSAMAAARTIRELGSNPMAWLRTRRPEPAAQVWREASVTGDTYTPTSAGGFERASAARSYGIELAALLALIAGTLWIPYLGWIVGLALTMASRNWSVRDKGIALALIPALTLGAGICYVWLTVGRDRSPGVDAGERFDEVSDNLLGVFRAWPIIAALLAATWLMAQLLARWSGAPREPWR